MSECEDLKEGTGLLLPPMLCAPVAVYARIHALGSDNVAFDWGRRFDKRFKDSHRFAIADTRGRLELTVPIAKPESSACRWDEIRISAHGGWWNVHRVALESAYGRTPYFEFYIDRLLPMLTQGVTERYPLLRDLASAWDDWIRSVLQLPAAGLHSGSWERPVTLPPYWQVRADRLGFIPDLSVIDLIFNLGPEAVIYLDRL